MTKISVSRDELNEIVKKSRTEAESLRDMLSGLPTGVGGGGASDKIPFIIRAAVEAAGLASDISLGLCAIADEVVEDQLATEAEVVEALDNFSHENFG